MDLTQLEVLVGRARQEIAAQDAARAQRPGTRRALGLEPIEPRTEPTAR